MGTIILQPESQTVGKQGKVFHVMHVVDGQQRLTALTILMSCICRRLWPSDTAENLYDQFIAYCKRGVPDRTLQKLELSGEDNGYFWDAILSISPATIDPRTPGQRRLMNAKTFFENKLASIGSKDLERYVNRIQTRVLLLSYQVGNDLDAGLVFETLNDRGKSLSNLDKIKSYLMYLAAKMSDADLSATVNARWGDLLRDVAQIDPSRDDTEQEENRLVRYHWIVETGDYRVYEIHREIKKRFKVGASDAAQQAKEYVIRLAQMADLYLKVQHPETSGLLEEAQEDVREKIRYYLLSLNRLGTVANFVPLIVAALNRYSGFPESVDTLLRLCYLMAWRAYRVCGRRADAGIGDLSIAAHELANNGDVDVAVVADRLVSLIDYYADDILFAEYLGNRLSHEEHKFFFFELEVALSRAKKQPTIGWDAVRNLEVEHVWAQSPVGYDLWPEGLKERHQKMVNSLGNLVLIPPPWNKQLSNRPLLAKQDKYAGSNLEILRSLSSSADFQAVVELEKKGDPAAIVPAAEAFIQNRTRELTKFAIRRWSP
jgi:hypothetical protein